MVQSSGEPIKNPVTGAEHRVRIDYPESFKFRLAEIGSGTSKTTGAIELDLMKSVFSLAARRTGFCAGAPRPSFAPVS